MFRRLAILGFAATLLSSTGCSEEEKTSSPATPVVTALPSTVNADGVSTTTITVTAGTPPFSLLTSRGAFSSGGTSTTVPTVNGFAVLETCDARQDPACAGPTVITVAGGDGGMGQIVVSFQGFEDCDNGTDDNGDGARDCADPQCPLDSPCGANGLVCSATAQCNKCVVPGNGPVDASGETHCGDALDNDCDGSADCADPDCADEACTTGTGSSGICDAGACGCAATEETGETSCGDDRDNDCDNLVDCADPDCVGDVCDATRGLVCAGVAPLTCRVCPTGQTTESATQCGDGRDNDCDGAIDCFDTDCQPQIGPPATEGPPAETLAIDRVLATQFVDEAEVRRQVTADAPRVTVHLARIDYFLYYRVAPRKRVVEVVAFWHASRGSGPHL